MKVVVIDGQGGRLGRLLVEGVSEGSLSDHAAQAVEALAREAGAL